MLRRLGSVDAAFIVMGGILGSGIFINPGLVAGYLHSAWLSMLTWCIGGAIALLGAMLFAELASRRPSDGGFYAYVRDAFHPIIAFVYGWTLLLVAQSGGMAAGAVTFAIYVVPALGLPISTSWLAVIVIALFTLVNCFGVRSGALANHLFMGLNAVMIVVVCVLAALHPAAHTVATALPPVNIVGGFGLALVAVLFAYDGWHTASFSTAELRDPQRTLPRGIVIGIVSVIALYLLANWAFLHGLGLSALAKSETPATDLARTVFGNTGAGVVTALVAIATMSTLAQQILVSPRVYHQMAVDGTFFRWLKHIDPRTRTPLIAIVLQGLTGAIVAASGRYSQILNYVESVDFAFFGLAAIALFVFRKRDNNARVPYMLPWHPWSTLLFLIVSWGIVADDAITSPGDTAVGLGIMALGVPAYLLFRRFGSASS